jgi:hypothetical protein
MGTPAPGASWTGSRPAPTGTPNPRARRTRMDEKAPFAGFWPHETESPSADEP